MPGGGGGPPPKWAIANPLGFGVVVGVLLAGAFLVMSAVHGQLDAKALGIGAVAGVLGFVVGALIAASYRGDVSQGW